MEVGMGAAGIIIQILLFMGLVIPTSVVLAAAIMGM
jgi:hypothetical protein